MFRAHVIGVVISSKLFDMRLFFFSPFQGYVRFHIACRKKIEGTNWLYHYEMDWALLLFLVVLQACEILMTFATLRFIYFIYLCREIA